jgi:hypothetical protein
MPIRFPKRERPKINPVKVENFSRRNKAIFEPSFTSVPPQIHHILQPDFRQNPRKITVSTTLRKKPSLSPRISHPILHGNERPSTRKENKLRQPDDGLHHRWHHRRQPRVVYNPSSVTAAQIFRPGQQTSGLLRVRLFVVDQMTLLRGGHDIDPSSQSETIVPERAGQPQD